MALTAFIDAWTATKREEGGYVNNPRDKGGPTNHGITEAVARANGFSGDMRSMTVSWARIIAKKQYWDIMRLDDVAVLSAAVAAKLFDAGFLCGTGRAGMFLQESLNVLNRDQKLYGDVKVDGVIGPVTLMNLRLYMNARRGDNGEAVLLKALNIKHGAYLMSIDNEEFTFGWLANRVNI
jgi:lysozyme family protein